jgi:hypothetical protein
MRLDQKCVLERRDVAQLAVAACGPTCITLQIALLLQHKEPSRHQSPNRLLIRRDRTRRSPHPTRTAARQKAASTLFRTTVICGPDQVGTEASYIVMQLCYSMLVYASVRDSLVRSIWNLPTVTEGDSTAGAHALHGTAILSRSQGIGKRCIESGTDSMLIHVQHGVLPGSRKLVRVKSSAGSS